MVFLTGKDITNTTVNLRHDVIDHSAYRGKFESRK
jgi:hypothetical protein